MKQYLLMLKQAGLIVEAVDFGVSSLIRLHNHLYDAIHNPIILCNIGQTQSLLSIVTKDSILAQHNVAWGIQILLRRILTNLELSNEKDKAKILLIKYGLVHEDRESCNNGPDVTEDITTDNIRRAIYQIIASYMEELTHELHKIVGYVRSEERNVVFEGIYMYGQAPFIRCLDHYLERRLNSPTTLINPMTKVALSDNSTLPDISEGAPFALALGLAMRKVPWL
jgi:Tfp pilus assembly PilM family ATPase